MSKEIYNKLVALGAPKLPEGYSYEIWLSPYSRDSERKQDKHWMDFSIVQKRWWGYKTVGRKKDWIWGPNYIDDHLCGSVDKQAAEVLAMLYKEVFVDGKPKDSVNHLFGRHP